ncbi:hypothetical protein [Bacteroides sp. 51]|uniref:hypothetical protein n=1 Tax=Bacteroides sp. 51 TaxID=2302938 RepID=UPI0013D7B758|nr:hypothetical protein [Bacteroides sp. 51]NDV80414.1 hypothetical protein [Bacteroides sp. 51]
MKRFIILLLVPFICLKLSSQEHSDNSIDIIAYWNIGDKATYEYSDYGMKIVENDTIYSPEIYKEWFSLEVIDSTATGYDIRYRLLDYKHLISNNNKEVELFWSSLPKGTTAIFHTNEFGALENVVSWEIPEDKTNKDEVFKDPDTQQEIVVVRVPGKEPTILGEEPIESEEGFLSKIPHVTQLFYYHGNTFQKDSAYYLKDKVPSAWNDELIDVQCQILVIDDQEEKELIHILNDNVLDSDQLFENYKSHFSQFTKDTTMFDDPERNYMFSEENFYVTLHWPSGWNVSTFHKTQTTQGKKTVINIKEINVLFDE